MKIVFVSLAAFGHLYPMMPLALACVDAGHDVVVATGEPFLGRLPIPTVPGQTAEMSVEWAVSEAMRRHPGIAGVDLSVALFADPTAGAMSEVLIPTFEQVAPDLIVYEAMSVGAGIAADVLDIPAAAFAIGLAHFVPGMIHSAAVGYHGDRWADRGRTPPAGTSLLANALLDPTPPSLGNAGDGDEDRRIRIRSVAYSENLGTVPQWLAAPRTRPRVYLTLGTVSFGAVEVLRTAVTEIASLDVDVLVAVGPDGDPATLGEIPDNVHVEHFVAQSLVLPLVDLVVHHGGTGTVLGALAAGLPQLIMPQGADQFYNAEALTGIGAARALLNHEQQPGAISNCTSAMLGASPERAVAVGVQAEIATMPSPVEVIPRLVRLAGR